MSHSACRRRRTRIRAGQSFPIAAVLLASAAACASGRPPRLEPVVDQQIGVGEELTLVLIGSDPDGDALVYSFAAAEDPHLPQRARIGTMPGGAGQFRWTPAAADVGWWHLDFTVSDGAHRATVTAVVEVVPARGEAALPLFRRPQGAGTTIDLAHDPCATLEIVVEDADSTHVELAQEPPLIAGATLEPTGPLSARWRWCPTPAQAAADDRYTLVVSADDGDHPRVTRTYLVVLDRFSGAVCAGAAPLIQHVPHDFAAPGPVSVEAVVSDDRGIKSPPLVYVSRRPFDVADAGPRPEEFYWMERAGAGAPAGAWVARDIPSPAAGLPRGSAVPLHYAIVAVDNDDPYGECDHQVTSPTSGSHVVQVISAPAEVAPCAPCQHDEACGGAAGRCVPMSAAGTTHCLPVCRGPADCPAEYTCSSARLRSVDGALERLCVPTSNTCEDGATQCQDDTAEPNDTPGEALIAPPLPPGAHDALVSCPAGAAADDEDWFRVEVAAPARVSVHLAGETTSDLDLGLYDRSERPLATSVRRGADEEVALCVAPGSYFLRVFGFRPRRNRYSLALTVDEAACAR